MSLFNVISQNQVEYNELSWFFSIFYVKVWPYEKYAQCVAPFNSSPSVLIPRFDLRFAEVESVGHVAPVRHAEVFLASEFSFQKGELGVSESSSPPSRFASFGRL